MILLDSYAVLALLKGEPAAVVVESLLSDGADSADAALTSLGVAEVLDHLVRLYGADEEEAVLDLAQLGLAPPVAVTDEIATSAGLLRARSYQRRTSPLSLADCVAAETARLAGSTLATSDPPLLRLCRRERIRFLALPDSRGRTWSP